MINRNYAQQQAKKMGERVERVINNKLEIYFAKKNPAYLESSIDRPNFYDKFNYDKALVNEPTLTKEAYTDRKIKEYEDNVLELVKMDNSALIQAFMVDNTKLVFSLKPTLLAKQLNVELKDIFHFNYLKVINIDTNEIKYFWIGDTVNNEDRRTSATMFCTLDFWTTYYKDVVLKMQGDVIVVRKHFDRFTNDTTKDDLKFNYSYDSNVYNIDGGYAQMPNNIIGINGILRPNVASSIKETVNTLQTFVEKDNLPSKDYSVWGFYDNIGDKFTEPISLEGLTKVYLQSSLKDFNLQTIDWTPPWSSELVSPGVNRKIVREASLKGDFVYTFQYNVNKEADKDDRNATYGIEFFDEAQSNNQYDPITTGEGNQEITIYNKKILNRISNVIHPKSINSDDLQTSDENVQEIIINAEWRVNIKAKEGKDESLIFILSADNRRNISWYKPYRLNKANDNYVYFINKDTGEKIYNTTAVLWNLGGFTSDGVKLNDMYFIDFTGEIENITLNPNADSFTSLANPKWTFKYKTEGIGKITSFSANEWNKDNYSEMVKSYNLQVDGYEWLNNSRSYKPNMDFDFSYEPQIYMSHCFNRYFNYLGAGKSIPYEIFGNDYKMYINQLITPSTAVDTIFITSPEIRARLMLSNGGVMTSYDNTLPSISDAFVSYMQQNQAQLKNSYLTAQGNLHFAKQQQVIGIIGGVSNTIGSAATVALGINSIASPKIADYKANRAFSNYSGPVGSPEFIQLFDETLKTYGPAREGVKTGDALLTTGGVRGALGGVFSTIDAAIGSGAKSVFQAEQQIKQLDAFVKDTYNSPDELINPSTSIQEINNYYKNLNTLFQNNVENNGTIRALEILRAPTLNNIKAYALDIHKHGYISNRTYFNQSIDTLLERERFNYIQLGEVQNMLSKVSLNGEVKNYFLNTFNSGVRLWNIDYTMLDYSKENWEIRLVKDETK